MKISEIQAGQTLLFLAQYVLKVGNWPDVLIVATVLHIRHKEGVIEVTSLSPLHGYNQLYTISITSNQDIAFRTIDEYMAYLERQHEEKPTCPYCNAKIVDDENGLCLAKECPDALYRAQQEKVNFCKINIGNKIQELTEMENVLATYKITRENTLLKNRII